MNAPVPVELQFELGEPTPTLNTIRAMHFHAYKAYRRALAWQVRVAIGRRMPSRPFERAAITIERISLGTPDRDGFIGGCKPLLDVLQPVSKRHPTGLGIIANDDPAHLTVDYVHSPAKGRKPGTIVTIREVSDAVADAAS